MPRHEKTETRLAVELVWKGSSIRAAAQACGITRHTLQVALRRRGVKGKANKRKVRAKVLD